MILPDVNILVYAHREDSVHHTASNQWLKELVNSGQTFGLADLVLSGFIRVVTHPRVFFVPTPLEKAWEFVEALRSQPNAVLLAPGERHWHLFKQCCERSAAKGNLITDAYLAALAIESGAEWISTDRDFARFPGLKWRHPFD